MEWNGKIYWTHDDGGRADAGRKGTAGDCVTRAVAIAARMPYATVYDEINDAAKIERPRNGRKRSSARNGVTTATVRRYLASIGWTWYPVMGIGTGCTMHLNREEIPSGRLIVKLSKHVTCVIDGVIHDTYDPSRNGTRCVYGYWYKDEEE